MNKKELMNLGLTDEQADSVLEMLKDAFVPLYRFNEINEKMKTYKSQVETLTNENKELTTKVQNTDELSNKIRALETASQEANTKHATELANLRKSNAIDNVIRDSKAKNIKAVKALIDLDKVTFNDDKLEGLDEQLKTLQESDNSKFLFEGTSSYAPRGAVPGEPSGDDSNKHMSFGDAIKAALSGGNKN